MFMILLDKSIRLEELGSQIMCLLEIGMKKKPKKTKQALPPSALGDVRNMDNASAAPLGNISVGSAQQDASVEDVDSALDIPAARGGVGQIPGIEHWFLGFKEGDYNDIDIYDDYI